MTGKKVLFVISEDWALISHRLHLVQAAIAVGYEVGLAARFNKQKQTLKKHGIKTFNWNMNRGSLNPVGELIALIKLYQILWLFKPDIIYAVAQKPVIYTGLIKKLYRKVTKLQQ